MKKYVDYVLKKSKKPINLEKVFFKVEELLQTDDNSFYSLSLSDKYKIEEVLEKGIEDYDYIKTPNDRYTAINKTSFRKGRFYGNRNNEGFVISRLDYTNKEGNHVVKEEKFVINRDSSNNAIDGDLVLIDTGGKGVKPKVCKIIERNLEKIMGEVERIGNSYFVKPIDKKKKALTIAIEGEAIEGQRVAVNLKQQTSDNFYIGEITRVFNHKDDPDEDILWEAFKCGIDDQFSKESIEQLKFIPNKVLDTDKIGREDLTDLKIFTIDGADTKDIDDALSIRTLPNGHYEVGVHIADVSHYVTEGSALDKDAYKKGTSNYLANKVIPMLPHELSNGICSLNPYVERLTLSCIMELNKNGEVVNYRITPAVIKSNLKMTYDKVNDILKYGKIDPEYEEFTNELVTLNKLALILRKNRILNGAIEFDRPELKLLFDKKGKVSDFSLRNQDFGENLIEEFMVLANETVDKHLSMNDYPCAHRVHDQPNEERLGDFLRLLDAINIPFDYDAEDCANSSYVLQSLTEHIKKGNSLSNMLSTQLIRCMSRAKYSAINIGHNGLAKDYYCHFTSPIRRYPDLTVHRIVKDSLNTEDMSWVKAKKWESKLPEICMQSSRMEKIADEAENQVLYMKCSEYMKKHIGEEYKATVIGLSDRNIQIQLDNMVEGRVRMKDINSHYTYNPTTYTLISLENKENYYIGDRLLVKVLRANKEEKTIDFSVVKKLKENTIDDYERSNQEAKHRAKQKLLQNSYQRR